MPQPPAPVSDSSRVASQELAQLGELGTRARRSSSAAPAGCWEVVERAQRTSKLRAELRVTELEDVLGTAEVLQPVQPEVGERHAGRKPVADEVGGRARDQDLAAVSRSRAGAHSG